MQAAATRGDEARHRQADEIAFQSDPFDPAIDSLVDPLHASASVWKRSLFSDHRLLFGKGSDGELPKDDSKGVSKAPEPNAING